MHSNYFQKVRASQPPEGIFHWPGVPQILVAQGISRGPTFLTCQAVTIQGLIGENEGMVLAHGSWLSQHQGLSLLLTDAKSSHLNSSGTAVFSHTSEWAHWAAPGKLDAPHTEYVLLLTTTQGPCGLSPLRSPPTFSFPPQTLCRDT